MIFDRLAPLELRQALDVETVGVSSGELREAAERLSAAYRSETLPGSRSGPAWTSLDYLAYAASRMPATYHAAAAVFGELRARSPALPVESVLDIGTGPATCLWAAWTEFPDLARATLVESDPGMIALGKRLLEGAELARRVAATWQVVDVGGLDVAPAAHDLVVCSYVLSELEDRQRQGVVEDAWVAARGAVAFVEPGSPRGYLNIMEARDRLIALGARIIAPCPHAEACPLPKGDWCHFGVRLNRTALQRRLKGGALPYEDEKYVYVIATRGSGTPAVSRVIRRPTRASGRVMLRVCRTGGVSDETLTKGRREVYRAARRLRWGDAWR